MKVIEPTKYSIDIKTPYAADIRAIEQAINSIRKEIKHYFYRICM